MLQFMKRLVLGSEPHFRVAPFGLARGAKIYFDPRHHLRRFLGLEESRLHPHVRRLLRPGMKTFDIGGEYGYYAVQFGRLTGGPVVSFEPDPAAAMIIEQGSALNGTNVTVVQSFVSKSVDPISTTLDAASDNYFVPELIKIDVEGAEYDVLQGGLRTLKKHKPILVIEVHSKLLEERCSEFLNDLGYSYYTVNPNPIWDASYRKIPHNRWIVTRN